MRDNIAGRQYLPGLVCGAAGGFNAGALCSLLLSVGCQVIPHVFRCWAVVLELFSWPTPPSSRGMYMVSILVSTVCSVWRCLVVAAHRAVMDTPTHSAQIACGSTILSSHHSPSLSIVDEFNQLEAKWTFGGYSVDAIKLATEEGSNLLSGKEFTIMATESQPTSRHLPTHQWTENTGVWYWHKHVGGREKQASKTPAKHMAMPL